MGKENKIKTINTVDLFCGAGGGAEERGDEMSEQAKHELTKDDIGYKFVIDDNRTTYGRPIPGGIQYELHNGAIITTIALSFEGLAAMVAIARRIDELQVKGANQ